MAAAPDDASAEEGVEAFAEEGFVEAMLAPISEENPCGADATYDDNFQLVKEKVDGLNSFSGHIDQEKALAGEGESFVAAEEEGEQGPFAVIEAASRRLLREKSKDLRIACYLCLALAHERGLGGVADGLALLRALCDTYWDDLHPPLRRMRARGGALTFLFQRLSERYGETDEAPSLADRPALEHALAHVQALQTSLMEKMGDQAPLTSTLKKNLEALLRRAPDPPSEEDDEADADPPSDAADDTPPSDAAAETDAADAGETEPPADTDASPGDAPSQNGQAAGRDAPEEPARTAAQPASSDGAPAASAAPAEVDAPDELSSQELNRRLLRLAAAQRAQDDTQAAPYRIARALRWDPLQALPPHDSGDRQTRVAPPPEQRRAYLSGLPEKEDYQRLVSAAEESFRQSPFHFWLDLQRLLARGLDALGAPYASAADAVRRECALLVERLPGLPALCFRDGTPFASPATREWIDTSARPLLGAADGEASPAEGGDALAEQFQEARRMLAEGDLAEALEQMRDGAAPPHAAASRQHHFRRRLYRALLCTRAGAHDVARPAFEALSEEADRRGLADWDPPLALRVWSGFYECLAALRQQQQADPPQGRRPQGAPPEADPLAAQAEEAFARVCEIDPAHAISLER